MSSTQSKIITVIGATGQQGSSVLRSLAANPVFSLRGTSRTPYSPAAHALAALNVKLFPADAIDPTSFVPALTNAWGAFLNLEIPASQGIALVDAIAATGVKVLVFSSLPPTEGAVKSFDDKAMIWQHAIRAGFESCMAVVPGWYMENFYFHELSGGFPFAATKGEYIMAYPAWGPDSSEKTQVPLIDIGRDFGDIVHGLFKNPSKWNGQTVQAVSELRTYTEIVAGFEKITGKKGRVEVVPADGFGSGYMEEMVCMFKWLQGAAEGRYYGVGVETDASKAAELKGSEMGSWETWVEGNVQPVLEAE